MNGGPTLRAKVDAFLEERVGLSAIVELGRHKRVPIHRHTIWYYMGGMTLFLFGIQVATGILLLLSYRPSADQAFESVQFIMTKVQFGWLVRSMHSWSANLLIFILFLHLGSVFFMKAYRRPRELTWLTGVALLALMMTFGFSGYLLPWNTLAFFATQVGTEVAGAVPVVGPFMLRLLRGGEQVTGGTLTRFYGFHVAVLPAIATALLGIHLILVQKHGMSEPPSIEAERRKSGAKARSMAFIPHFALRDAIGWCAALAVLAGLAALFPWELGTKADPFAPAPAGIRPEWYFCWMFQALKLLPGHILGMEGEIVGILGIGCIAMIVLLVPFIDRTPGPGDTRSRILSIAGWVMIGIVAVLTVMAYLPPKGGPS
jgi:quinol-cytochrome oxidoreductase complex cytochrome b subunit